MHNTEYYTDEEYNEIMDELAYIQKTHKHDIVEHPDQWESGIVEDIDDDWIESDANVFMRYLCRVTGKDVEWFRMFNSDDGTLNCKVMWKVA